MNILFVHFPSDNDQIEGLSLPKYFASQGHEVYCTFHKGNRNFDYRITKDGEVLSIELDEIVSNNFEILVAKSSSRSSYDQRLFRNSSFKVNVLPLGISQNLKGYDFVFGDGDLIKPPVSQMFNFFMENSGKLERTDTIIFPASIGTDKNQLEFLNLVDPEVIKDHEVIFCGKIVSQAYADSMTEISKKKKLKVLIKNTIPKTEVAELLMKSKIMALTTDPRPAQPYDPSPRVVSECLCAGTPFFINDLVFVDPEVEKFGWVYKNGNSQDFNEKLQDALKNWKNLSDLSLDFSKNYYKMETACLKMYDKIMSESKI